MKSEAEINAAIDKYADTIRRVSFMYMKNYSDTEDVFQEVFLKYLLHSTTFESDAHEKAWLIRVAINTCKDVLKAFYRRRVIFLEDMKKEPIFTENKNSEMLDAILRLPERYRNVIYLYYYEGYTAVEISKILNKGENTIYTWLSRAKKKLKDELM